MVNLFHQSISDAWLWVKGLKVGGSTNTLAALKLALADELCEAIYLLTDGRPDQVRQCNESIFLLQSNDKLYSYGKGYIDIAILKKFLE